MFRVEISDKDAARFVPHINKDKPNPLTLAALACSHAISESVRRSVKTKAQCLIPVITSVNLKHLILSKADVLYPAKHTALLWVIAAVYFELRQNCDIFLFQKKKGLTSACKTLIYLAPPDGLEPPT